MGQPVPFVNGQQTHAQAAVPLALTLAVLIMPLSVPGSPDPVSPEVPCQGSGPRTNPESAVTVRSTDPEATHTVCEAADEAAPPATETEHQER